MLRIRTGGTAARREATAAEEPTVEIVRDFDDPQLEVVRLLREASEIEHALLVQYLYAAFSVKPAYPLIMGFGLPNANDLIGVAVQEMQHLDQVNRMLVALGAVPTLARQDFPYEPDIYPFPLNLEPLGPLSLAKYTYTEAPAAALDRDDPANAAARPFLDRLFGVLGDVRPNHLGSLYGTIIALTQELIDAMPGGSPDLTPWLARLEQIRSQGEDAHFRFFRDVFMGTHRGFAGHPDIWALLPDDPAYPALALPVNPSAFEGHERAIADPAARELAWLGNLQYWVVLALLDRGYRSDDPIAMGLAKAHMTGPLQQLGTHLAGLGAGLPFDPLSMGYELGVDRTAATRLLLALVGEAEALTVRLRDQLPADFAFSQNGDTLAALGMAPGVGTGPGTGGTGPGPGPGPGPSPTDATEFWFEFDDRFLFNVSPEIGQAYAGIRGPDFLLTRWRERRRTGQYPQGFVADTTPMRGPLEVLSREQLAIIRRHLSTADAMRQAFEDFGQGVLFDDRRDPGNKVHMMDTSGPASPPIGYHRWHAITRAMVLLEIEADVWMAINRLIGLGWAVQSQARPVQDTHNPPLDPVQLMELRVHWGAMTGDELDAAFDSFPLPPAQP